MLWLGLSSLVLAVCVVVLAIMLLSIARQIGVLHERTQPMASRLQTMEVQEGDALEGLELPVQAEQSVEVALLFVSTACPVCRSLHGSFAELLLPISFSATPLSTVTCTRRRISLSTNMFSLHCDLLFVALFVSFLFNILRRKTPLLLN